MIGTDFKIVDLLICIIFVKKHSASKVVRVFSNLIRNMVIGPNKGTGFVIVIIGPSEIYRLFSSLII